MKIQLFQILNLKNDEILNFAINQENVLKLVASNSISEETRRSLKPVGTRSRITYGLRKVHEDIIDNCLSFLPILLAINTRTYILAKFLVPILKLLTSNEYTVKDLFAFAEETVKQDSQFFTGNLDVDFLFTNIPLEETIDICLNKLFENMEKVGLSKIEFKKILSLTTKETHFLMLEVVGSSQKRGNFLLLFWLEPTTSNIKLTMTSHSYKEFKTHFLFKGKLYKQADGVTMGSPLGLTLANAFLVHFEKNWLQNCPPDLEPYYYQRYVYIFLLFTPPKHLEAFRNFLNGRQAIISITIKSEKQKRLFFLDVQAIPEDKYFPILSTVNLPLVEFIQILTDFYHLRISLALFTHSLIDACEFALIEVNHAIN